MSPFLVLAALLPAALLLLRVYRLDRIEKEPASVLWALLGCGAAAALQTAARLRRIRNDLLEAERLYTQTA